MNFRFTLDHRTAYQLSHDTLHQANTMLIKHAWHVLITLIKTTTTTTLTHNEAPEFGSSAFYISPPHSHFSSLLLYLIQSRARARATFQPRVWPCKNRRALEDDGNSEWPAGSRCPVQSVSKLINNCQTGEKAEKLARTFLKAHQRARAKHRPPCQHEHKGHK